MGHGADAAFDFPHLTNPDGTYNRNTATVVSPFQLQAALRYSF